jgi:hypothetical protein
MACGTSCFQPDFNWPEGIQYAALDVTDAVSVRCMICVIINSIIYKILPPPSCASPVPLSFLPPAHTHFMSSAGTSSCSSRFTLRRSVERWSAPAAQVEGERYQRIELPLREWHANQAQHGTFCDRHILTEQIECFVLVHPVQELLFVGFGNQVAVADGGIPCWAHVNDSARTPQSGRSGQALVFGDMPHFPLRSFAHGTLAEVEADDASEDRLVFRRP